MGLDSALSIAGSGLSNVQSQLALVSHNVANAGTAGYVAESLAQQSLSADGQGMGVRTGVAVRDVDTELQESLFGQNAAVANLQTIQALLAPVSTQLGSPGQGNDLSGLLSTLKGDFTALADQPDSTVQQAQVVSGATSLADGINALGATYARAGQAAGSDLADAVGALGQSLAAIGTLSDQIIAARSGGRSSVDLENQRDTAMADVSHLVDARFLERPDGDLVVMTQGGLALPTRGQGPALGTAPGGPAPVLLGGVDVTAALTGGRIGADLAVRDVTLPGWQAELDEFAQTLASRFDAQGLTLFTDAAGQVPEAGGGATPQAGYVGFSGAIGVNPVVAATPSLVRDGTHAVTGSASGASAFAPNPTGVAGFTGLVARVLDYGFGADIQPGVAQPAPKVANLGAGGTLSAPFAAPATLEDFASTVVSAQSQDVANTGTALSDAQGVQTALQSRLQSEDGVSIDAELSHMVELQNAYGANARIVAAVQSMWSDLLGAVNPAMSA